MLRIIFIAIVVVIAAVLVIAAFRPDTLHVERSTRISTPPQKIFRYVNDFHQWGVWSPYEKLDPALKRIFSGPEEGKGAVYEWEGNKNVGQGRMEIIESSEPGRIGIRLDFIKPFEAHNLASFTFQPDGASTRVTWAMDGPALYFHKLMGLFINMDRLIGKDFETGLANLKSVSEK